MYLIFAKQFACYGQQVIAQKRNKWNMLCRRSNIHALDKNVLKHKLLVNSVSIKIKAITTAPLNLKVFIFICYVHNI